MNRCFAWLLRFFYNIALIIGLVLSMPILLLRSLATPGYARWLWRRLLPPAPEGAAPGENNPRPVIWLHALSVGEAMAARPLLVALRRRYPGALLLFSSSTRAGVTLAGTVFAELADRLLVMPSDLPLGAGRLARYLRPDLFILVETDFWPNLLHGLRKQGTPLLLVNGRMSSASWRHHRRWFFLSRPLIFDQFSHLAMQTAEEAARLSKLGVDPARIAVPGNLKYPAALELLSSAAAGGKPADPARKTVAALRRQLAHEPPKICWLAGSTHGGEEEILLRVFRRLLPQFPQLLLVLAPRRIERAASVLAMARAQGCRAQRLGDEESQGSNLLVVDSYGCLTALYPLCDVAFIGGSLVPEGGHNPLEAAVWHRPVVFGRHLEDFAGIADDLLAAGAARRVEDEEELFASVRDWLLAPAERLEVGQRAGELVATMGKGVMAAHIKLVEESIASRLN